MAASDGSARGLRKGIHHGICSLAARGGRVDDRRDSHRSRRRSLQPAIYNGAAGLSHLRPAFRAGPPPSRPRPARPAAARAVSGVADSRTAIPWYVQFLIFGENRPLRLRVPGNLFFKPVRKLSQQPSKAGLEFPIDCTTPRLESSSAAVTAAVTAFAASFSSGVPASSRCSVTVFSLSAKAASIYYRVGRFLVAVFPPFLYLLMEGQIPANRSKNVSAKQLVQSPKAMAAA